MTESCRLEVPSSTEPTVSIVLVLRNQAALTFSCLLSIRETVDFPTEVIIVDNASTDETPRLLEGLAGARIVRNEENFHFLKGCNQGAALARGRHILLLNNDAQLLPGSLRAALETLESSDDIGIVGVKIILFDDSLQEAGRLEAR